MARTAAERKREQRARLETRIAEEHDSQWDEAVCLHVLTQARYKGTALGEAAWKRLGAIHGYDRQHRLV